MVGDISEEMLFVSNDDWHGPIHSFIHSFIHSPTVHTTSIVLACHLLLKKTGQAHINTHHGSQGI